MNRSWMIFMTWRLLIRKRNSKQRKKTPRCTPPRNEEYYEDQRIQALFLLAAGDMMATSGRITGQEALASPLWKDVSPVEITKKRKINALVAPQRITFLQQCHATKKFWFEHLVKCCTEEKPDDLRNAVCEKPCGGNVGFKPGQRGQECYDPVQGLECGSDKKQFSKTLYCCTPIAYHTRCDYVGLWDQQRRRRERDLPQGQGWGWM
mmetsp:Transcript_112900/g.224714  ORF Transcript_112900/g.224714 Transcript_112900/m.224714 type:complete len:207 (+) Transcript_112900:962-1582(+)